MATLTLVLGPAFGRAPQYPLFLLNVELRLRVDKRGGRLARDQARHHQALGRAAPLIPLSVMLSYLINLGLETCASAASPLTTGTLRFSSALLAVPLLALALIVPVAGVALAGATLNALYRDVAYVVTTALLFLFWLTPVVYPPETIAELYRSVLAYNPLAAASSRRPRRGARRRVARRGRVARDRGPRSACSPSAGRCSASSNPRCSTVSEPIVRFNRRVRDNFSASPRDRSCSAGSSSSAGEATPSYCARSSASASPSPARRSGSSGSTAPESRRCSSSSPAAASRRRARSPCAAEIAPVLSIGLGFHPDMTGRESLELNARLLGYTPAEIAARHDAIVASAGSRARGHAAAPLLVGHAGAARVRRRDAQRTGPHA